MSVKVKFKTNYANVSLFPKDAMTAARWCLLQELYVNSSCPTPYNLKNWGLEMAEFYPSQPATHSCHACSGDLHGLSATLHCWLSTIIVKNYWDSSAVLQHALFVAPSQLHPSGDHGWPSMNQSSDCPGCLRGRWIDFYREMKDFL